MNLFRSVSIVIIWVSALFGGFIAIIYGALYGVIGSMIYGLIAFVFAIYQGVMSNFEIRSALEECYDACERLEKWINESR